MTAIEHEILREAGIPAGDGRRVLVAMSGGVDSSVAAALLVRAGYDVVGCFMRLGSPGESLEEGLAEAAGADQACDASAGARIGHRGCCSISDAADARLVAAELGIPFYVCNFKAEFARIIDYFVSEYEAGRTPNPCVRCNDWLKFGRLHEYARQIGAGLVASGHYARVVPGEQPGGLPRLKRGRDLDKDQSYVLFGVRRDRLGSLLLPVGGLHKPRVRELAERFGLPVFDKPDSQEICFVPDDDYAGLVERRSEAARRAGEGGDILDTEGRVLGRHAGQHRFTIGQRRGHGLALGHPVYVVGKDAGRNTITVGSAADLGCASCTAAEVNWLSTDPAPGRWFACSVQHRAHGRAVGARVCLSGAVDADGRGGVMEVVFDTPEPAVTPGQAIVVYGPSGDDDARCVLGGGWIRDVGA